jgi:ubiquitin carboxyl-terminal hydrolase L3
VGTQELLAMVPQPVKAVLMLFPITEATEAAKESEETRLKDGGQHISPNLWFTKQTISNACGTVAMLHAFANGDMSFKSGSFLERYLQASQDLSPQERAKLLESPEEGQPDIEGAHKHAAQEGQTAPPPEEEQVRSPAH